MAALRLDADILCVRKAWTVDRSHLQDAAVTPTGYLQRYILHASSRLACRDILDTAYTAYSPIQPPSAPLSSQETRVTTVSTFEAPRSPSLPSGRRVHSELQGGQGARARVSETQHLDPAGHDGTLLRAAARTARCLKMREQRAKPVIPSMTGSKGEGEGAPYTYTSHAGATSFGTAVRQHGATRRLPRRTRLLHNGASLRRTRLLHKTYVVGNGARAKEHTPATRASCAPRSRPRFMRPAAQAAGSGRGRSRRWSEARRDRAPSAP